MQVVQCIGLLADPKLYNVQVHSNSDNKCR